MLRHRNRHARESKRSCTQRRGREPHQPVRGTPGAQICRSGRPDFLAQASFQHSHDIRSQLQRQDQQLAAYRPADQGVRHYAQSHRTGQLLPAPRADPAGREWRIRLRGPRRHEPPAPQRQPQRPARRPRGHHPQVRLQNRSDSIRSRPRHEVAGE